ncbi:unnamed protein product [Albugo candida]|uniref:Uncharacterized protein n=1 Tax=Albugo candida TaxID=65357 RepID=A0A024FWC9_9STRA|nr:unnamed protein product [Albugo candida]|eukprot:CCI11227.1 unnamed protein product [Albugo candida]
MLLLIEENCSLGSRYPLPDHQRIVPWIYMVKSLFYQEVNNTTLTMCELPLGQSAGQQLRYQAPMAYLRAQLYLQFHQHELAIVELYLFIEIDQSGTLIDEEAV